MKFGQDNNGVAVCMFQQSSASTAESMNAAHRRVRDRTLALIETFSKEVCCLFNYFVLLLDFMSL